MVDEDFYQPFLLSPFWADLSHSKSQKGVWEAMKTPTFLRASRPPKMDNCQNLLGAEQNDSPGGALAKYPINLWMGHVTVISVTKKKKSYLL